MSGQQHASFARTTLGRTGFEVGRLGVSASYGVPTAAVERAFDEGLNYFFWGSLRREAFGQALRNLSGQRERFVLVLESYSRAASLLGWSVEKALRQLRFDCTDVLVLGMWNRRVPDRILDAARRLKERGLVRTLALSTHHRPLIAELASEKDFDIFQIRYNAVHPGAERDIFPHLPVEDGPGIASFTATSWGQLLKHKRIPSSEKIPTAGDCYRFVLSQPCVDVCLTGPSNAAHMDHAIEALRRGPMSEDELAWMRRVGSAIYRKGRFKRG